MPENRDEFIKRRVARQKKIRKRRLKLLFLTFVILALLIGIILSLTVFFKIKNVTATGSKLYSESKIVAACDINTDDNLFLVSEKALLKRVRKALPYVEEVKLKRVLPDTLKVTVTDAEEFYTVYKNSKFYTVSQSGYVLKEGYKASEGLLSVIGADFTAQVGEKIVFETENDFQLINEIIEILEAEKISLQGIDFTNRADIILKVDNRFTVRLGANINTQGKINQLSAMIKKISAEEKGTINLSMWTLDNKKGTFVAEN